MLANVWDDLVEGLRVGDDADRSFSGFLEVNCRLVYLPDESVRPLDPTYGVPGDQIGLTDGFPFLLVSDASLLDLNFRLELPLPMNRFRPYFRPYLVVRVVVRGCEPFAEDDWKHVRIGSVTLRVVKPCARCAITTADQRTAEAGEAPLRTLARFRKVGKKVLFGHKLIHDSAGTLRAGYPVEVLQTKVSRESNTL